MLQNELELCDYPYNVRKSKRAKRIFLRIMPGKGLEVVIPERLKHYSIDSLLETHKPWIQKTLQKYKMDPTKSCFTNENYKTSISPSTLHFEAIQKKIYIVYQKTDRSHLKCQIIQQANTAGEHTVIEHWLISGDIDNKTLCQKLLNKRLKKEAEQYLIPWLQKISLNTQLAYDSVKVRLQSSLWGSCTRLKNISLNAKLLFVEPRIVQYVLIHELCHTIHLNHSSRFWKLVSKYDPDYLLHRQLLKEASRNIM